MRHTLLILFHFSIAQHRFVKVNFPEIQFSNSRSVLSPEVHSLNPIGLEPHWSNNYLVKGDVWTDQGVYITFTLSIPESQEGAMIFEVG